MIIKHKTVIALAFCVLLAFFALSCGNSHPDPKVESLQITPTNPSIPAGGSQQMTVTAVYKDGTTGDVTSKVSWSSSDETVATVSAGGLITTNPTLIVSTPLSAEITAMYGFNVLTFTVTITPAQIFDIAISRVNTGTSIANGTSAFYNATAYFTNGGRQDVTASAFWNSSDTSVAAIPVYIPSSIPPQVSTTGAGVGPSDPPVDVTISAKYSSLGVDYFDSITLTVTPAKLSSISIGPASASIAKGTSQQFTATGLFGDGSTQTLTTQVTWHSDNAAVASISNSSGTEGLAAAVGEGTAIINAVDPGSGITSGDATLTVTPAILDAIVITPADPSIANGTSISFTAAGIFTDSTSQDLTSQVTWVSSDETIATISNTAGSEGEATAIHETPVSTSISISAIHSSGISNTTSLTVTEAELVSIAVIPSVANIAEGGATFQFDAEGTFTDSSTQIITSQVGIWSSDNPGVADVVSGLATSGTQGTALINAVYSGSLSAGRTVAASDTLGEATLNVVPAGVVMPLYNTNGADWNDYVANDGPDRFNAFDNACDPATDTDCLHGGEMRMVELPITVLNCDDLAATDSLGAFNWTCRPGTPVRMVSTGLKDGLNLTDLLDFSVNPPMWKKNSVAASNTASGTVLTMSHPAFWWPNNRINYNETYTMASGDIYIVDNPGTYTIGVDKVAFVIRPGVSLTGSGGGSDIVYANSTNFLWLEGAIDVTGYASGIKLNAISFSVLRNVKVFNAFSGSGISLAGSSYNRLSNIIANNNSTGINFDASSGNIATDIAAFNNALHGVHLVDSSDNVLSELTTANNEQIGIYLVNTISNMLTNITSSNNKSYAIYVTNSSYNSFMNLAVSNSSKGIFLNNTLDTNLSNLAVSNNGTVGIDLLGSSDNHFEGLLEVGSNATNCDVSVTSTNPGIDTNCNPSNPLVTFVSGITLASSFIGKVTVDDTVNTSDTDGAAFYLSISDWYGFENSYRGWGLEGSAFPDADNRGQCAGGTCRMWDWSLANGDTVIKDVLGVPPDGSYTLTHTWSDLSTTTFLRNAVEIKGDGVGNDNTLCEGGERCLFTPNIGSYQGHGSLTPTWVVSGGTLNGIRLTEYSTNGR